MPEPISIASAALSVAGTALKTCKQTYDLIQGIKNAPQHVARLRAETEGVYNSLATLQRILESEVMNTGSDPTGLRSVIVDGMIQVLQDCMKVFNDVQTALVPFIQRRGRSRTLVRLQVGVIQEE